MSGDRTSIVDGEDKAKKQAFKFQKHFTGILLSISHIERD